MKEVTTGFVIVCIGHPTTGRKYIVNSTFRAYKRDAIKSFIAGSGESWKYWRDKYNFRCARATQTIEL